ncbi:3-hydroxyacyl-CoA dehydrogenase [Hymenobacter sp. BT664]|uniref:3-hydroxyacyl-CoA dehydrogenase n=1 Tax=Hymenobacter montanus TaxID=2771359 RepID=A0A927BFE2_9BACT|nr:3-hydroxyacyl-CoA dehydrogenase family protein [Hymenobacter montanus]MBD2769260.1 3-hydroxyacyl-CoA dehydrogenase [Hymenobacter montanus]
MHILVIDGEHVEAELRQKFGLTHQYSFFTTDFTSAVTPAQQLLQMQAAAQAADVVFCCKATQALGLFASLGRPVFVEASCAALPESLGDEIETAAPATSFFGFCGLPTLLNRALLEVSLQQEVDRQRLADVCTALGTAYRVVENRVGLVTPRVICQIINEACYTVQEGTASLQDVDLGMKLGTNYPHGPFVWANALGVERVYTVLEALWNDTHDERYKICPLLKRQALRGQPFAV